MPNENIVSISVERFEQLVRAEQDANNLKKLIAEKFERYSDIDRSLICLLYAIYFGNEEDTEE